MGKKEALDLSIVVTAFSAALISAYYIEELYVKLIICFLFVVVAVFYIVLYSCDVIRRSDRIRRNVQFRRVISELVLLNEENTVVASWDIYGKVSLVIGKDSRNQSVDINLNHSAYAGMIDNEHAVLNYTGECWYIEDLGSQNGISIQKASDGKKYKISSQPCKVELGDVIYIGLTRLQIR